MPYEMLEQKIRALPQDYYEALVNYLHYLTEKAAQGEQFCEADAFQKMREVGLKTVWEYVKDDTW